MAAASTMGWMNWLSIAALGIAVVALVASFGIAGPALVAPQGPEGPQGPQGDPGPQGAGTVMAWDDNSGLQALTPTCTNYAGAAVAISVPGPGTVVVIANAQLQVELLDREDIVGVFIDTKNGTAEGCVVDAYQGLLKILHAATAPGSPEPLLWTTGVFVQKPFVITQAGTFTFYLNVLIDFEGQNPNDAIIFSSMIAVFYPT